MSEFANSSQPFEFPILTYDTLRNSVLAENAAFEFPILTYDPVQ